MIEYISKLNDRNLQRKRESGFTSYALISFLVFLVYQLFENYPAIPIELDFNNVFLILSYTFNVGLAFYFMYITYLGSYNHNSSARLQLQEYSTIGHTEFIILMSLFSLVCISNLYNAIWLYTSSKTINWYFILLSIPLLMILILGTIVYIKRSRANHKYDIKTGTGNPLPFRNFTLLVMYTTGLFVVIYSIYHISRIDVTFSKTKAILFGLQLFAVPVLLKTIISLHSQDNSSIALENLEYEIHVNNLTEEQIREKLQKNHMGFLLPQWIQYTRNQVDEFNQKQALELENIKKQTEDIKLLDAKSYPIEYKGRNENLSKAQGYFKSGILSFYSTKFTEIESIWAIKNIDGLDRQELGRFYKEVKALFKKYDI